MNFYKYRSNAHGYVVAPGGSGKSHMIAGCGERLFDLGKRVLVLARSEKLLSQNKSKFDAGYHDKLGVYCSGLDSWNVSQPITIGSVQSLANVEAMPKFDVALVDECDEIPDDEESQYRQVLAAAGSPTIIGFTATDFRTGTGNLAWGEEIIRIPLKALFDAGYLTPPTNKVGTVLDLEHVPLRLGEYQQAYLDEVYADPDLLALSLRKIKQYSEGRKSCLIFCQSIKHADMLASAMEYNDMPCQVATGDTDKDDLSYILHDFEEGHIKYLVTVNLLVRGYDMPCVDMIAILRATKSKRLFEQMLYRGTRLKEGKKDFLVLDMGNNFMEHGPLGSPYVGKSCKAVAANNGKICPTCEDFTPPLAKDCATCGYVFPEPERPRVDHARNADFTSTTVYDGPVNVYDVTDVVYKRHTGKNGKPDTLRVDYYCGFGTYGNVSEWLSVAPQASDWAKSKATEFFKKRGNELGAPIDTYSWDDLLWHAEQLKKPSRIEVDHSEKFPRVTFYWWPAEPQKQLELDDAINY